MNPCPCGYAGHPSGRCHCTPDQVARYQGKISGPLLDRIDMQVQVAALPQDELMRQADGESSAVVADRVACAWERQLRRQGKGNHALSAAEIDEHCRADARAEELLRAAMTRLQWSARAYHRVLKLARTIADLAEADGIGPQHVAEAVQYRRGLREH